MICDQVNDVATQIETVALDQTEALKTFIATLVAGLESRLHDGLVEVQTTVKQIGAATQEHAAQVKALWDETKTLSGDLAGVGSRLGDVEGRLRDIAHSVQAAEGLAGVVSVDVATLKTTVAKVEKTVSERVVPVLRAQQERQRAKDEKRMAEQREQETMAERVNTLKTWTGKARAAIIYDSKVDPFTDQDLFDRVKGKPNIALVVFTADGSVFGGFYTVAVTEQKKNFFDPDMFVFSFESHGRCKTPQRFAVKADVKSDKYVYFFNEPSHRKVVNIGGRSGCVYVGTVKTDTYCVDLSRGFEGLEDSTLSGKLTYGQFVCARLVAVHLF